MSPLKLIDFSTDMVTYHIYLEDLHFVCISTYKVLSGAFVTDGCFLAAILKISDVWQCNDVTTQ